jgi:hypothetical protein
VIQDPVGVEDDFITGMQLLFFLDERPAVTGSDDGPVNIENFKRSVCVQQNRRGVPGAAVC